MALPLYVSKWVVSMKAEEHIEVIQHTHCGISFFGGRKCNAKEDHSAAQQFKKKFMFAHFGLIFLILKMHIFLVL